MPEYIKYIPINNAKDLIFCHVGNSFNDEKVLKGCLTKLNNRIKKIKAITSEKIITSNAFQYKEFKLYFIETKETKECLEFFEEYNKSIETNETKEIQLRKFKDYLFSLIIDMGFILYPEAHNLIIYKLEHIIDGMDLDINRNKFMHYCYHISEMYGEKLNYSLNILYLYKDLLEKMKNFSFKEWDHERAMRDAKITYNFFNEKYKKDFKSVEFFEDYFQLALKFTENGCNELFKIIKDNNIKFN